MEEKQKESKVNRLMMLDDPELRQKIVVLRNEGQGRPWADVTKLINADMDSDYTPALIQGAYENELSIDIQIEGNREKLFSDNIDKVKLRYDRISQTIDKYQTVVDNIVAEASGMDSFEALERVGSLLKVGKQVEVIHNMVDKQISLLLAEMEKISIKASKTNKKEMSDTEVMNKIKEYMPVLIKNLEVQGKIRVIDTSLIKK